MRSNAIYMDGQDMQDKQDKKTFLPQSSQRSAEQGKTPLFLKELWISANFALDGIE